MKKINIFTSSYTVRFAHQLDKTLFPESEYEFYEDSDADIEWDLVIVYEGVKTPKHIRYKKGGLIFMSGEPPMSRVYPQGFLNQFDTLITQHPNLRHPQNIQHQSCLNWLLGLDYSNNLKSIYTFEELANMPPIEKTKNISMITSSQRMMPGHNRRMNFLQELKKNFGEAIDLYGRGIKPINTKMEALKDYRFAICIENSNIPHYWTEKFADPILAYTIPIYFGCTNITDYFSPNSFISININKPQEALKTIRKILNDPEGIYQKHLPYLLEARKDILKKYNFFNEIERMFGNLMNVPHRPIIETTIKPVQTFRSYKFLHYKLRFTRLLYKWYLTYIKK